jgi:dTDP-4-amino-4,6-dideoxygalactose transaminase
MTKFRYPLSVPDITELEIESVIVAMKEGEVAQGNAVSEFEDVVSNYHLNWDCAVLNSGTSAIHLALRVLGVKEGDFVLVPNHTFAAALFAVKYLGATPVIVDFEANNLTFDLQLLKDAILFCLDLGKVPRALITVDLYGNSCDYYEIRRITEEFGIPILEDAAEAVGSTYDHKPLGTFGDVSILSFNANKIVTTGGGGAVLSENSNWIEEIKFLANQAKHGYPHFIHQTLGYNYRLSNLAAAVGLAQFQRLPEFLRKKKLINDFYSKSLTQEGFKIFQSKNGTTSNNWLSLLSHPMMAQFQDDLVRLLQESSIETRPGWRPMTRQPVFRGYPSFTSKETERWYTNMLALPSAVSLTFEDLDFIVKNIKKTIELIEK